MSKLEKNDIRQFTLILLNKDLSNSTQSYIKTFLISRWSSHASMKTQSKVSESKGGGPSLLLEDLRMAPRRQLEAFNFQNQRMHCPHLKAPSCIFLSNCRPGLSHNILNDLLVIL
jgi:hypothetical protein